MNDETSFESFRKVYYGNKSKRVRERESVPFGVAG